VGTNEQNLIRLMGATAIDFQVYTLDPTHGISLGNYPVPLLAPLLLDIRRRCLQCLGVENIVLGSDYPAGKGDQMKWEVELLKGLELLEVDREKIASGNAQKLFKL